MELGHFPMDNGEREDGDERSEKKRVFVHGLYSLDRERMCWMAL